MGFFGKLFVVFIAAVILLGIVGWIISKRKTAKNAPSAEGEEEALSEKTVNNVLDLNDRFNRARYMDEDSNQ